MIGEIVAGDFRTASVFTEAGIDFCCGGKKTLGTACAEAGVDEEILVKKLADIETSSGATHHFNEWDLSFLADYIMNTHHKYVMKTMPEIKFYTQKIAGVHGERHHELAEIAHLFSKINTELLQHLKNEEEVLFPAIKKIAANEPGDSASVIISEITRMFGEHEFAGGAMDRINQISGHYMVPDDGCNTYRLTYQLLKQFEDDLHIHVHLENNILFPKALKLAETVL